MVKNLPLMSLSILDIFVMDAITVISLVLRINFVKIHMDSEVVLLMT